MKYSFTLALLGALAVQTLAAPVATPDTHVLHERREVMPMAWTKREAVNSKMMLPVRIGMKQRDLHTGYDRLMDVSRHDSPNYGKHYSAEAVNDMFAPARETVESVRAWLINAGIPAHTISQSANKGWMQFDASTEDMEALLKTKFHIYEHSSTGHTNIACDEYHVPEAVRSQIDYITPGIKLLAPGGGSVHQKRSIDPKQRPMPPSLMAKLRANPKATGSCDTAITPACLRALYNIPLGKLAAKGNSMGIFEQGDTYAQGDLDLFYKTFFPVIPKGTKPIPAFQGSATAPVPLAQSGAESDLDFQMAYPIIWPQSTTLYQTDANQGQKAGFLNPFLDALDGSYCTYSAFGETGNDPVNDPVYPDPSGSGFQGKLQCGIYKPANVISVSYGETEDQLPPSYQQRQCNEFMKLGLQGVSVLFASGDSGVAGRDSTSSNICLGPNNKIFNPGYPVNCPFITTVGATVLPAGTSTNGSETAVVRFGSGGGFSNIYPQPDYQKAALATYFANHDPGYKSYNGNASFGANGGIYNRIGRAYPDVAASGDNGAIFVAGKSSLIGGTSMSSPIFGAILNRINEERIAAGKSTVGFVNPTLYANPSVLNDVTAGDNSAGGACGTKGFAAVTGWDPVTGLGTPNYPKMLALFLGLK